MCKTALYHTYLHTPTNGLQREHTYLWQIMAVHTYVPIKEGILSCLYILSACKYGCNCVTKSNAFHCTCTYQLAGIHGEGLPRYYQHLLHSLWSCLERDRSRKRAPSLYTEGYTNWRQRETLTMAATKTVSTSVTLYVHTLWSSNEGSPTPPESQEV